MEFIFKENENRTPPLIGRESRQSKHLRMHNPIDGSEQTRRARFVRRFPLFVFVLGLLAYTFIHVRGWTNGPIISDGYSYYVYLPAWFLLHDPTLDGVAQQCCGGTFNGFTGIRRWPTTGRWLNPHPIGTAVLLTPFFAVAHALTRWSNFPPNGFSIYYQHGAGLAGLTYVTLGLALVAGLLSRYFSPGVTIATLVTITWGTNLFHYGTFDPVFSHAYSFFLIATLLVLSDTASRAGRWSVTLGLGLVAGLTVLTRHANVAFLAIVPCYGATSKSCLKPRQLSMRPLMWLGAGAMALLVIAPQLAIYKAATGSLWVNPYALVGGFDPWAPHVWNVLFSVQKGLFFWSPALLLSVVGVCVAREWSRAFRFVCIAIFAVQTYLIGGWPDWQFGGSYGHRGFTDGLAVAALFMASAYQWVARVRGRLYIAVGATLAVALSLVQMIQYWMGMIPIENTTWSQYRNAFLRF
jgi:hypothetical protein